MSLPGPFAGAALQGRLAMSGIELDRLQLRCADLVGGHSLALQRELMEYS
jgi:hypothetical protein